MTQKGNFTLALADGQGTIIKTWEIDPEATLLSVGQWPTDVDLFEAMRAHRVVPPNDDDEDVDDDAESDLDLDNEEDYEDEN